MWPPVRQFDSYDRVPFGPSVHPSPRARRERSRPRRHLLAVAVIISVAALPSIYVVAASAVPRTSSAAACPFSSRSHARTLPSVFCELAGSATSAGRARLHRWP
jgi:hypothetical protein